MMKRVLRLSFFIGIAIISSAFYEDQPKESQPLSFRVVTDVAHQQLDTKFCWFHPG